MTKLVISFCNFVTASTKEEFENELHFTRQFDFPQCIPNTYHCLETLHQITAISVCSILKNLKAVTNMCILMYVPCILYTLLSRPKNDFCNFGKIEV